MTKPIRILIADDHNVVRHGLKLMLERKPGIKVIGEAKNGAEVISLAGSLTPDVILMDLEMPLVSGLQAISTIHAEHPDIRILVLTSFTDSEKIASAIRNGAAGYMIKDTFPAELVAAIRDVANGEVNLPPEIVKKLVEGLQKIEPKKIIEPLLTHREQEILMLSAGGLSNQEIASKLFISESTIRFHFTNIYCKLEVNNRSQAIIFALRRGLVKIDENSS